MLFFVNVKQNVLFLTFMETDFDNFIVCFVDPSWKRQSWNSHTESDTSFYPKKLGWVRLPWACQTDLRNKPWPLLHQHAQHYQPGKKLYQLYLNIESFINDVKRIDLVRLKSQLSIKWECIYQSPGVKSQYWNGLNVFWIKCIRMDFWLDGRNEKRLKKWYSKKLTS